MTYSSLGALTVLKYPEVCKQKAMHTHTRDAAQTGMGRTARIRAACTLARHAGTYFEKLGREVGGHILAAERVHSDIPLLRNPAQDMYGAMAGRGDWPATVAVGCTHDMETAYVGAAAPSPAVAVGPGARVVPVETDEYGQVLALVAVRVETRELHTHPANGW